MTKIIAGIHHRLPHMIDFLVTGKHEKRASGKIPETLSKTCGEWGIRTLVGFCLRTPFKQLSTYETLI